LTAVRDIRRLKARYAFFLDTKNWETFRELFTDDMVGKFGEGPEIVGGERYAQLAAEAAETATTVHHFHEPILKLTSATTAIAIWPVFAYLYYPDGSQPTTQNYGHYHERYRLTDDGRRIAYLHTTFLITDDVTESHPVEKATISLYTATAQAAKSLHT
jgi:SnoaL-like domain